MLQRCSIFLSKKKTDRVSAVIQISGSPGITLDFKRCYLHNFTSRNVQSRIPDHTEGFGLKNCKYHTNKSVQDFWDSRGLATVMRAARSPLKVFWGVDV